MEETQGLKTIEVTSADQEKPLVNKNYFRLYDHHLCPFAEKVRLCLASKNLEYQNCQVDLGKKTQWHIDINGGLAPALEFPDGTILSESKVLMDFVEEAYKNQGYQLLPKDPLERAKIRLAMTKFDSIIMALFGPIIKRSIEEKDIKALKESLQKIEDFLDKHALNHPFAWNSENPTHLDFHIYPQLVRVQQFKGSVYNDWYEMIQFDSYPKIQRLIQAMQARKELKEAFAQTTPWHHYLEVSSKGTPGVKTQLFLPLKF